MASSEIVPRVECALGEGLSQLSSALPPGHCQHWVPPPREGQTLSTGIFLVGMLLCGCSYDRVGQRCQQPSGRPLPVPATWPRRGSRHARSTETWLVHHVGPPSPPLLPGWAQRGMGMGATQRRAMLSPTQSTHVTGGCPHSSQRGGRKAVSSISQWGKFPSSRLASSAQQ